MGNKYTISEGEKHFFDLTGYLIVQQALTSEEISKWNEAINQYTDKIRSRSKTRGIASKSEMLRSQSEQLELTGMLGCATSTVNCFEQEPNPMQICTN